MPGVLFQSASALLSFNVLACCAWYVSESSPFFQRFVFSVCVGLASCCCYCSQLRRKAEREWWLSRLWGVGHLEGMPEALKKDRDFFMQAVRVYGRSLEHADDALKADKQLVLRAVTKYGTSLRYASHSLRADREVVLAAVRNKPDAMKWAKGDVRKDEQCLKAAGLWEETLVLKSSAEKVVLSVKFNPGEHSTQYSIQFALAMRRDPFLGKFQTYNPNAWCMRSCDPQYTDFTHPCRGTDDTCQYTVQQNREDGQHDGRPGVTSCWRFASRYHLEQCKETRGFMIQVQEVGGLGESQRIETDMARQTGLKVFRTVAQDSSFHSWQMRQVSKAVKAWYDSCCMDVNLEVVYLSSLSTTHKGSRPALHHKTQ